MSVFRFDRFFADLELERPLRKIRLRDFTRSKNGAESLRLLFHVLDQVRPHNAVRKSRVVFNIGGQRQLAADLETLDDQRLEVCPRGINRGGVARTARSNDDDVLHSNPPPW